MNWVRNHPTGSGSWVRLDTHKIAVTVWRLALDLNTGAPVGWIKNWGTGTMPSDNRLVVALKAQFYGLDGVPIGTPIESTVSSVRVHVDVEEEAAPQ